MVSPTFLDLFSGCGGLSRAFVDEGFALVGAVDNNLPSAATMAANFGEDKVHWQGIDEFTEVPPVDVVVGGPPCQGFSTLGKRDPQDARNGLWREYVRVVKASGCKAFVLENVDRFRLSDELKSLRRLTWKGCTLEGYKIEVHRLNAANYGAPQRRTRVVVVGSRIGLIGEPDKTHGSETDSAWASVRDAIGSLSAEQPHDSLPAENVEFFGLTIPGSYKLNDIHVNRHYTPLSVTRMKHIPAGGNRFNLPDSLKPPCWLAHTRGTSDVFGRLNWDKPSVTIRTEFFKPEKGRYLHPSLDRALTHAEAALLQGFDDRHLWCGSKIQIARQIGNAVPPPLGKAMARQVLAKLA